MKIKFSRTLAIACVFCMAFATLTAFADVTVTQNNVEIVTGYDVGNTANEAITVIATVKDVAVDDEITYYVSKPGADGKEEIIYIDQVTATGTSVEFTFKAGQDDVLLSTAKNGSNKGYAFPSFTFAAGANYQTTGDAHVEAVSDNWGIAYTDGLVVDAVDTEGTAMDKLAGYVYQGKVSGQYDEYGVKVTIDGTEYEFPAKGCNEDGTFVVIIDGLNANVATAPTTVPYVK